MQKFARIADGSVAEIISIPDGVEPSEAFHPSLAATLVACDGSVTQGMTWDGTAFGPVSAETIVNPVPDISAAQARLWLLTIGKTSADVEAAIATLPSPARERALIEWEYRTTYRRASPMWDMLGPGLGIQTPAAMDAAFRAAAQAFA